MNPLADLERAVVKQVRGVSAETLVSGFEKILPSWKIGHKGCELVEIASGSLKANVQSSIINSLDAEGEPDPSRPC